jgi:cyclase
MRERFRRGADKITINSKAVRTPTLISEGAALFGSQAIVVSIDAGTNPHGEREVFIDGGKTPTGLHPVEWAKRSESLGAGEILLQVIEKDGAGTGYDLDLIREMSRAVGIPLIACSGVGSFHDYAAGIEAGASAVAAANLWHFKELADRLGKKALAKAGVDVRL